MSTAQVRTEQMQTEQERTERSSVELVRGLDAQGNRRCGRRAPGRGTAARHRVRRRGLWATAVALVASVVLSPAVGGSGSVAGAVTSPVYSPADGVVFNNPKGTRAEQRAIITQIDKAIDATPAGGTIVMAQYLFDIDSTADKLVSAFARGVHVQVLIDDGNVTAQSERVALALGEDRTKQSFVTTCKHSCMADTASVMHAKFYLFSRAGAATDVSMVSSANPYTGNTVNSWNNIHTMVGNSVLYGSLLQYFHDMIADRTDLNYYRTTTSGKYKLYLFPRAVQPGVDTVVLSGVLDHVACSGAAPGYGRQGHTVVRVAMWGWTAARIDLARKLWALHDRGCRVEVILNGARTNARVIAALLKKSSAYGVMKVYDAWVDKNHNDYAEVYMHHKLLAVDGKWFGHPTTKIVYTGSQNFTGPATRANNDILFRVHDDATYDAYAHNLDFIRDGYTKKITVAPAPTPATSDRRINALAASDDGLRSATPTR